MRRAPRRYEPVPIRRDGARSNWSQFSLRTLLLSLTALSVLTSCAANRLRAARLQKQVVDFVIQHNGDAVYEYEFHKSGVRLIHPIPHGSPLLRGILGDDYFNVVAEVTLTEKCSDEDIVRLRCLRGLRALYLFGEGFTDKSVVHLASLDKLQTLGCFDTALTADARLRIKTCSPGVRSLLHDKLGAESKRG
jgi:hypothetical protein